MPNNLGIFKEDQMVYFLNNNEISCLNQNLKNLLQSLFGIIDDRKKVYCEKTFNYIKPDLKITYDNECHFVSMKSGSSTGVHVEDLDTFMTFLRDLGVSRKTQETLLLFHYGDGTMDGTGEKRYRQIEVSLKMQEQLWEANKELNEDKEFIKKVFNRCLFQGLDPNAFAADALYFGTYEYGAVATRRQIEKHIDKKDWSYIRDNPHIGPLFIIPRARYTEKKELTDEDKKYRNKVQLYWPHLREDIEYISKRYSNYVSPYKWKE